MSDPARTLPEIAVKSMPAVTTTGGSADRLRDIEIIGERINGIVRFMCGIEGLAGTSGESRERALVAFHDSLVTAEKRLAHIQDKFRLE